VYTECIHFFYDGGMEKRYPGPTGKCFKNGKIQLETEEAALVMAKEVRKKRGAKLKPYICTYCGYYHIGHDRPPEFRKQR